MSVLNAIKPLLTQLTPDERQALYYLLTNDQSSSTTSSSSSTGVAEKVKKPRVKKEKDQKD